MKKSALLFSVAFLFSFSQDMTMKETAEISRRIRTEFLSNKPLPKAIDSFDKNVSGNSKMLSYGYDTIRIEENRIDTVTIMIFVHKDSLEHLSFHEMHFKNGKEDISYMYQVDKFGAIDWAYYTNAPKEEPQLIKTDSSISYISDNSPVVEINTDTANAVLPAIIPDKKTIAKYTFRLTATLKELDKILFGK